MKRDRIIIRNPDVRCDGEADIVIGNDDAELAIAAIRKLVLSGTRGVR